jgi:hypothetical protein
MNTTAIKTPKTDNWHDANQRYLSAALAVARGALERHLARLQGTSVAKEAATGKTGCPAQQAMDEATAAMPAPSALETLCATFGLSPFERHILLLCAGTELDSAFASLCAAAQGDARRSFPTFSLALAALPSPHWSALTPAAPLRCWRLIEVGVGDTLTTSPLRIDERVLHYLTGVSHLDERLAGIIEPLHAASELVPSHRALADRIAQTWSQAAGKSALPIIQLCGDGIAGKATIAMAACAALGLNLNLLSANVIPASPSELEALIRLWEREAALSASALFLECDEMDPTDAARVSAVRRLIESLSGAIIIASREPRRTRQRPIITFEVRKPSSSEQRSIWQSALSLCVAASKLNGQVEALVSQFNLSAPIIYDASAEALRHPVLASKASVEAQVEAKDSTSSDSDKDEDELGRALWDACRARTRPRLDDLAQRLESAAAWDDLVLPELQLQILRQIAVHVRQRAKVYETWGYAAKSARGLGISALFSGPSGTGKTLAAEVLANELRLDLYRIDLSQVVSKYIGETEKNLRRVFEAAEEGGAILLFDEADALFGKRSEVKDSHDRYANIEISYLLQRMEAYRGLAILTTNMKNALDPAFLRRIRFIVQFPFPDAAQRAEIWRRIFPPNTPTEGLDIDKLARLNVAGGNIRNIALNAAFLAADSGSTVRMTHLLRAARSEYAKLEKSLTEVEIGGWV